MTRKNNRDQGHRPNRGTLVYEFSQESPGNPFLITRLPVPRSLANRIDNINRIIAPLQSGVQAKFDPSGYMLASEQDVRKAHKNSELPYNHLEDELFNHMGGTALQALTVTIQKATLIDRQSVLFEHGNSKLSMERVKALEYMRSLGNKTLSNKAVGSFSGIEFSKKLTTPAIEAVRPAIHALVGQEVTLLQALAVPLPQ